MKSIAGPGEPNLPGDEKPSIVSPAMGLGHSRDRFAHHVRSGRVGGHSLLGAL